MYRRRRRFPRSACWIIRSARFRLRQGGIPFANLGLVAAAVNPLANIGIVVNGTANNGYVLDLKNSLVLQTVAGFNSPQAVAVNPLTNTAYIVNQGNNTVSVFPMATIAPNPLQILDNQPVRPRSCRVRRRA